MSVELEITRPAKVKAKELRINCKVCDNFTAALIDDNGDRICSQEDGYVPNFMPGKHFGDYLILNIDIATGQITNWKTPNSTDLEQWISDLDGEGR